MAEKRDMHFHPPFMRLEAIRRSFELNQTGMCEQRLDPNMHEEHRILPSETKAEFIKRKWVEFKFLVLKLVQGESPHQFPPHLLEGLNRHAEQGLQSILE